MIIQKIKRICLIIALILATVRLGQAEVNGILFAIFSIQPSYLIQEPLTLSLADRIYVTIQKGQPDKLTLYMKSIELDTICINEATGENDLNVCLIGPVDIYLDHAYLKWTDETHYYRLSTYSINWIHDLGIIGALFTYATGSPLTYEVWHSRL